MPPENLDPNHIEKNSSELWYFNTIRDNIKEHFIGLFNDGQKEFIHSQYARWRQIEYYLAQKIPILTWPFLKHILQSRISNNEAGLITGENINKYSAVAEPWDILLTRSDWYVSNAIIRWFWKHMALYAWTGKYLRTILNDEALLKVWELDDDSHYIIEATAAKWTQIKKIDELADVQDYLAAFRLAISKEENRKSICNVIQHLGKPYDYATNVHNEQQLSCQQIPILAHIDHLKLRYSSLWKWKTFYPNEFIEYAFDESSNIEPVFFIDYDWVSSVKDPKELLGTDNRAHREISYTRI